MLPTAMIRSWLHRQIVGRIRPSHCSRRNISGRVPSQPKQANFFFRSRSRKTGAVVTLLGAAGVTTIASSSEDNSLRHIGLAIIRCERIARAVVYDAVLYKQTFNASYGSEDEKAAAYSKCHKKSAERVLEALQANGGGSVISST